MATADQLELGMDLLHVLRFWSPSGVCFTKDVFVTDFVLSDKDVGVFANRFIADGRFVVVLGVECPRKKDTLLLHA